MTTAREAFEASGLLDVLFSAELAERIAADVETGAATWGWDPDVDGVIGLRHGREIVVIVWLEAEDFEVNGTYAAGGTA